MTQLAPIDVRLQVTLVMMEMIQTFYEPTHSTNDNSLFKLNMNKSKKKE